MAPLRPLAFLLTLLTTAPTLADSATFGRHASAVGDAIEQVVRFDLQLDTAARQGATVIEEKSSEVQRQQRRRVTATDVVEGRVVGADVRFFEAGGVIDGESQPDPVAGKQYRCTREGETLRVTGADGATPPFAEYELVLRAMETLGTVSPLAEYLAGRTVEVGELVELPAEVAQQALGFDEKMGVVDRFNLTLRSVETVDARRVARFDAVIETSGGGTQQMRLVIEGAFRIEEATCRVVSADLTGPIAMSGARGVGVAGYQLDGRGKMRLALTARYRDATR